MTHIGDVSPLSEAFRKRAEPPVQHIEEANSFLNLLSHGNTPSEDERSTAQKIYDTLTHNTERYSYNAAILAGQEASPSELDNHIDTISKNVEQVERIKDRLSAVLFVKTATI